MTQREIIRGMLKHGETTASEIAAITGLSLKTVAAYCYALSKQGKIVFTGRYSTSADGDRSKLYKLYTLKRKL